MVGPRPGLGSCKGDCRLIEGPSKYWFLLYIDYIKKLLSVFISFSVLCKKYSEVPFVEVR